MNLRSWLTQRPVAAMDMPSDADLRFLTPFGMTVGAFGMTVGAFGMTVGRFGMTVLRSEHHPEERALPPVILRSAPSPLSF